ncbi:MAG: hypothetical protein HY280_10880 [Nitrospinae bacterium]|nr:hypothetical protein [Nitrospinota bacterium]
MKLLISVISPLECAAFSRWPDYVDIKNPADGSLGMPSIEDIMRVKKLVASSARLSCAIGEATDDAEFYAKRAVDAGQAGADIIKVGLFSFSGEIAISRFLSALTSVNKKLVAAVYADRVEKTFLKKFPEVAKNSGAWGCLIDTFDKTKGGLFSHLNEDALKGFIEGCRKHGLQSALAGGLAVKDLPRLAALGPDIVGFRSAVAKGARGEPGLDPQKLSRLMENADKDCHPRVGGDP